MMDDELIEKVARAVGNDLASMHGGCFNPSDDPAGECADSDCYCSRMCERVARAAIQAVREAERLKDAPTVQMSPTSTAVVSGIVDEDGRKLPGGEAVITITYT